MRWASSEFYGAGSNAKKACMHNLLGDAGQTEPKTKDIPTRFKHDLRMTTPLINDPGFSCLSSEGVRNLGYDKNATGRPSAPQEKRDLGEFIICVAYQITMY